MTAPKKVVSYVFEAIGEEATRALQDAMTVRGEILDGDLNTFHTWRGQEVTGVEQSPDKAAQIIAYIKATPRLTINVFKKLEGNDHVTPYKERKSRAIKDLTLMDMVHKGMPTKETNGVPF